MGSVAGMTLGVVLLVATWAKAIDPAAFVELIALEGLGGPFPAWLVATVGLSLEAGLGVALLLGVRRLWVLIPAAGLCLFFYLTGRAYVTYLQGARDPAAACGCFGNLVERTPSAAFWSDLLLLGPPLLLAFLGRPPGLPFPRLRMEIVAAAVLLVLGFTWKAPDLPLDHLATRLRRGTQIETLCVGQGENRTCIDHLAPELTEGRHLVILADLQDREFRYAVPRLSDLASSNAGVSLTVLTTAEAEAIKTFQWDLGPTFEIRHAPARLVRPLYRRTPRTALVEDGRVIRTYDGLPPSEDFTSPVTSVEPE